jgi:hypothetical protein
MNYITKYSPPFSTINPGGSPLCGRGVFDGCTGVGPGDDGVAAGETLAEARDGTGRGEIRKKKWS